MPMTRAEKKRALTYFKQKLGGRGCSVCGGSSWKVETDTSLIGAQVLPAHVILIGCLVCGQLLLFNTAVASQPLDEPV